MSGQVENLEKTSLFFSKTVDARTRKILTRNSGFTAAHPLRKYLRVPLIGRAPKRNDFNYLVDKVNNKLSRWKSKHLSFIGRVTFSKSVIEAIPIYIMKTNLILRCFIKHIQRIQRRFIWGDTNE